MSQLSRFRSFALHFIVLTLPSLAFAAGEGHLRSIKHHVVLEYHADKTSIWDEDYVWKAVDQQGANGLGQQYLSFDQDKQQLEIIEAETIRANGSKLKVPATDIKLQDGMLGGVSYPRKKLYQITFPKLAPGDAIHLHYRQIQNTLDLPGGDSHTLYLGKDVIRDDTSFTFRYPESMRPHIAINDVNQLENSIKDGIHQMRWHYQSQDTHMSETGTVNAWRQTPYIIVSSFQDWKAIADAYQEGAAKKAIVTKEVRELAQEITKNRSNDRDKAKALYDWVRKNIRYVASYIGDGGFVPNDTKTILEKNYGDCKDHATLLEALLEASGIPASQVLIPANTDNYVLPPVPDYSVFNHAINYLPTLNLFLDSTADLTPFGLLPENDAGHAVLVTKNFKEIQTTPATAPQEFKMRRTTRIALAADGSATRTTEITGYGLAAVANRSFLDNIGPGKEQDWAKEMLTKNGLHGTAELIAPRPDNELEVSYRYTEKVDNLVAQPEAAALHFYVGLGGPISAGNILERFTDKERKTDFKCDSFAVEDRVEFQLAPELKVLFMPKDVDLQDSGVYFRARYQHQGNTYSVQREWGSHTGKAWCAPEEYAAIRQIMIQSDKGFEANLLFMNINAARQNM